MTAVTALPYGRALTRDDLTSLPDDGHRYELLDSTRRIDLVLEHDRYRSAGCAAYRVVDPDAPGVRAWRLEASSYVEAGHAVADDTLEVAVPFPVRIRPGDLVR